MEGNDRDVVRVRFGIGMLDLHRPEVPIRERPFAGTSSQLPVNASNARAASCAPDVDHRFVLVQFGPDGQA